MMGTPKKNLVQAVIKGLLSPPDSKQTMMNEFSKNLDQQSLNGPLSSADRLAYYLLEQEKKHFSESIPTFTMEYTHKPHIFVYVLDHMISRGDEVTIDDEILQALMTYQWMPNDCKVITINPHRFVLTHI